MSIRIAIIGVRGYPYVYGGYETFAKELSERMVVDGHEVTIYCHKNLFGQRPSNVNGIDLKYFYGPSPRSHCIHQQKPDHPFRWPVAYQLLAPQGIAN